MENRTLLLIRASLNVSACILLTFLLLVPVTAIYAGVDTIKPNTLEEICTNGELKIGVAIDEPSKLDDVSDVPVEAGYPPYLIPLSKDNTGNIHAVGLDIEVIYLIREGFNSYCNNTIKKTTVYYAPFDQLFESLRTQQVDLLVAAISPNISSSKRKGVAYSQLYTKEIGNVLAAPPGISEDDFKLKDHDSDSDCKINNLTGVVCSLSMLLKGKTVVFLADTVGKEKLAHHIGIPEKVRKTLGIKPVALQTIEDVFQRAEDRSLASHGEDGFILIELSPLNFLKDRWKTGNNKKTWIKEINKWHIVEYKSSHLQSGMTGNAIATRIEDEKVLQLINQIINRSRVEGKLGQIQDFWFGDTKQDTLNDEVLKNLPDTKKLILQDMPKENPKLLSRSLEFGTSLGYPTKKGDSLTLKGNINYTWRWPFSYELRNPFFLRYLFLGCSKCTPNEAGFGLSATEGSKVDEESLSLNREFSFGPIFRWTKERIWRFKETFFGVHINATYTVKDSAAKVNNSFTETSDRGWKARVTFPEIGTNIPITDTVSIAPTVSYANFLTPEGSIDATINLKVTFH